MFERFGQSSHDGQEVDLTPTPGEYRLALRQIVAFGGTAEDKAWAVAEAERVKDVESWSDAIRPSTEVIAAYQRTTGRQFGNSNHGEV